MLEKNFTKPVYQKIGRVRALNFHANLITGLDRVRFRNQRRQRPGGVLKYLREAGSEGFKSNVGCVLKNAKTGHGILGEAAGVRILPAAAEPGVPGGNTIRPVIYHTGEPGSPEWKQCLLPCGKTP